MSSPDRGSAVDLTSLEIIRRYSLAVRQDTASRGEVIAALRADLQWLEGSVRSSATRPAATRAAAPTPAAPPAKKTTAKAPAKKAAKTTRSR